MSIWSMAASVLAGAGAPHETVRRTIDHQGDRQIVSGEFRYTLRITERAPSSGDISEAVEALRLAKSLERQQIEAMEPSDMRDQFLREFEDDVSAEAVQSITEQMRRNSDLLCQFYFALGNSAVGGDRYVEFSRVNEETGETMPVNVPQMPTAVLQRFLGAGGGISLFTEPHTGNAVAGPIVHSGTQEPQRLGRVLSVLTAYPLPGESAGEKSLDALLKSVEVTELTGPDSDATHEFDCLLNEAVWSCVRVKCRIDASKGYIAPLVAEYDAQDRLLREWMCEDYFQPAGSDLWFPAICTYRQFTYKSETDDDPEPRTERYEFVKDSVVLNNQIPDERFTMELPRGTSLVDTRQESGDSFVAKEGANVSLDDLNEIEKIPGITRSVIGPTGVAGQDIAAGGSGMTVWLVGGNILLVIGLVIWLFRRYSAGGNAAILLISLSISAIAGCGTATTDVKPSLISGVIVAPPQLNLGEIAADGRDVNLNFQV